MLICEELFLLLTKDSGKPESRMTYPVYGLTGALLTDLLLAGRISLTEERSPRIYIVSSEPTGNPVLDRALEILPTKDGKRFSSLVAWGKLNPTRHIAESLEVAGVVPTRMGAAPILVVGTTGDPATPYAWSQTLADQLESGRLLTWEGNGHTAYGRSGACIHKAVDTYLISGTMPEEGLTCKNGQ